MGCLAAYFTHVQSCDVTRIQSATQWTASVQTSHQDVVQYRGSIYRPSHRVRTSHAGAAVDKEAVTSRHVRTSQRRRGQGGRQVTSRHVTSGRHRRRRRQGGRHVTSRQGVTGAAVGKDAVTSRHVRTSRGHVRMPGRHVTSRHDVRRPQSGPCSTQPKKLRSMRMCCKFSRTSTSPPHPTQEVTFFKNPKNAGAVFTPLAKTT